MTTNLCAIPWQCTRVLAHAYGMSTCVRARWLQYVYFWIMTTLYLPVCWPHDYIMSRCVAILWLRYVYLFVGPCLCLPLVVLMSSIGASPILTVFLALCWPMTMSSCGVFLGLFYTCVLAHEDICHCAGLGLKSTGPVCFANDYVYLCSGPWLQYFYLCSGPWLQYVYLCSGPWLQYFYLCSGPWLQNVYLCSGSWLQYFYLCSGPWLQYV
jgi:hypothetical protein